MYRTFDLSAAMAEFESVVSPAQSLVLWCLIRACNEGRLYTDQIARRFRCSEWPVSSRRRFVLGETILLFSIRITSVFRLYHNICVCLKKMTKNDKRPSQMAWSFLYYISNSELLSASAPVRLAQALVCY